MQRTIKTGAAVVGTMALLAPTGVQASYEKTLSVATNADFPPYEYCENQEIVGIDIEIARLIADELGMELEICNMSFDSIFDAVESGKTLISIGRVVMPEEESDKLAFSDGYMDVEYAILVTDKKKEIQVEDLSGKTIGTADALHGEELAKELCDEEPILYEKEEDGIKALEQGKVDALVMDQKAARYYCSKSENLYILDQRSDDKKFVIATGIKQEDLLKDINDALTTMKETGELDKIVEKYLGEEMKEENQEDETE